MKTLPGLYTIGITLISISFLGWFILVVTQILAVVTNMQLFSESLFSLTVLLPVFGGLGMAVLLTKVILERIANRDDEYYAKKVDR